ncbi:hypothetical protein EJB05_40998 [Eragrostis curvula]|uniref:DUF1618 domain-containing protein n=1 Tax=Eragrostis curvula TaxID=38414 RepID=A0A5J9T8L3_9POAL|nr:hypothetical protein EJB05_40998 [Eragrostis curvula]
MMSTSDCVLLHGDAFRGNILHWNKTTARTTTRRGLTIEVSLSCPERPLLPTILFVSVPAVDFTNDPPRIVRAVEDLILLRIPEGRFDKYDYYIYRAGGKKGPSLKLLPCPPQALVDEDVGLLSHGEGDYTIAALLSTNEFGVYDLHRFDSVSENWSMDKVSLVEPQVSFPDKIPSNSDRLLFHLTSTVIPIGSKGDTMGWVDLWHGILLCDVVSREPKLRGVPLPLPVELMSRNNGQGTDLGCPKSFRGITFIDKPGMEPCLKFVHLWHDAVPIPQDPADDSNEEETKWEMRDWTITIWSNENLTASWKDWHKECVVKASDISISSKLNSKMLKSGLLSPGGAEPKRAFQNLFVFFPALGIDDGVVYLQARVKFPHPRVFVLALDTENKKLLGAAEFATERISGASVAYFPSNISKYIDPRARVIPIPKGDEDDPNWEEWRRYEGTESLKLPRLVLSRLLRRKDGPSSRKVNLDDVALAT